VKEAVVAYFSLLSRLLRGNGVESHERHRRTGLRNTKLDVNYATFGERKRRKEGRKERRKEKRKRDRKKKERKKEIRKVVKQGCEI
jgi:hypothetical protein